MASFSSDFSSSSPFVGGGAILDSAFAVHWPPEAGCIGFSVGGGGPFGSGVSPVVASVTDLARQYLARSITDGTSIRITHFAVGTSGYDPANPLSAVSVDPTATSLVSEVYRDTIDLVETATLDGTSKSFVARIGRDELAAGIGEIALIAQIIDSPFPFEIGTFFAFAIAHQPLNVKTLNHVTSYRVIISL